MTETTDKTRLLQGEHCSCGSHRLSISDDWYVQCKDCSDEWSAAELLVAEIKRLNEINVSNGRAIISLGLKLAKLAPPKTEKRKNMTDRLAEKIDQQYLEWTEKASEENTGNYFWLPTNQEREAIIRQMLVPYIKP